MDDIMHHAKILWDYLRLDMPCTPMDAIFVLGSDATRVVARAADLWHAGYGSHVIVSGAQAQRSAEQHTEGRRYEIMLLAYGVPADRIIVEERATNTAENILFVHALLRESSRSFRSFVLVQKPYMERRVYATFQTLWPEASCCVTSPLISLEDYVRTDAQRMQLVQYLVGTLHRIQVYPALGFQVPQEIPEQVLRSFYWLCERGFTRMLVDVSQTQEQKTA